MASEIRVDKITSLSGVGTISPSPTGVEIAGITTTETLKTTSAKVGSGITLSSEGNIFTTGISTFGGQTTINGNVFLNESDPKIFFNDGGSMISNANVANTLAFFSDGSTERLRITSAGLVGIGTDNPLAVLHVEKSGTSQVLARFESNMGTNDNRSLALTSPTSDSASKPFTFSTGNSIEFKIDAHIVHIDPDGRLGIGTDSVNEDLVIHDVSPSIKLTSTSTVGNTNIYFGDMDSNTQGQIQYHNNGDFFRFFTNGSNERLRILSTGGLTFNGDTAAANALDDYEEGDYLPSFTLTSGSITLADTHKTLCYTKIGRQVTIIGQLKIESVSSPSGIMRASLPFARGAQTEQAERTMGNVMVTNAAVNNANEFTTYPDGGSDSYLEIISISGTTINRNGGQNMQANTYIYVNYTYFAAT